MIGRYSVRVRNSRNEYEFEIKRNITILCGDSGKGKTTLFEMINEHNRYGKNSGVSVSCEKRIVAIDGAEWETEIAKNPNCIIVIDEDSEFIRSYDFASVVRNSDNYFILITRNYMSGLPYSVDEIYELRGRKKKKFSLIYRDLYKMYDRPVKRRLPFAPEVIITEDAKSGFRFYKTISEKLGIECISAMGKSKIYSRLQEFRDKNVVVIADGAAFGPEMRNIVEQQKLSPNKIAIFLPESFEWLILNSGIIDIDSSYIDAPEDYADSIKYMSWEQFFTDLLVESTAKDKYRKYNKERLADYYLQDNVSERICEGIQGLDLIKHDD